MKSYILKRGTKPLQPPHTSITCAITYRLGISPLIYYATICSNIGVM